jgi:NADH dehydrogenase [ubiquinone] 1 alpha subcomplex assembly factor 1
VALLASGSVVIFNFNTKSNMDEWIVVDDIVMGGKSMGNFSLSEEGYAVFEGEISIENNGGFSSVRYRFDSIAVNKNSRIAIRLKGDGKRYQFRVKDKKNTYYSYITYFETSGKWEEIELNLNEMYPSFRGRKLNLPDFSHSQIEEITFLIANSKPEKFRLQLDKIVLK